jgi:carboxypeptidase Taq
MESQLAELKARLQEVNDLEAAAALLYWDQATYMPHGGAAARGRQLATLGVLAHQKFTDPAIGRLLEALEPHAAALDPEADAVRLLEVTRRHYERVIRVPGELVARMGAHQAASYDAWTQARPADEFARVAPYLERTVELSREYASYLPAGAHPADPLIGLSDYGVTVAEVRTLFARLREALVPLVEAITAQPPVDDACLHAHYPEAAQLAFGQEVVSRFGYDWTRGRQDKSPHPFMTKFSLGDVRITTRSRENDLGDALFSTLHEAGHAIYEQGIARGLEGTPLAEGASSGVHESQSRLWENLVGRSRGFWEFWYPRLQGAFPGQLGPVPLESFYRAINKVQRSLIRTDADEVTYNLHVLLRFDFELALLEGTLTVRELPEAWRERYRADLGVMPPSDRDGVLQDVHWFAGHVGGAFHCYTLGNLLSAQFFGAATAAHPEILSEIRAGAYDTLRGWLTENLYRHGQKFTLHELVVRATGQPLALEPYLAYLKRKYAELYPDAWAGDPSPG